ncbi:MAG: hypothetical protein KBC34_01085 [Phenylobacterium sp.]|nr:hypothetical protein [Phenylobacterium sp.]
MPPSPGSNDNMPTGIPADIDERLASRFQQLVANATAQQMDYVMVPIRIAQASAGRLRRLQAEGRVDV